MPYSCYRCNKQFSQKGHLNAHLNKKKWCGQCPKNFQTQWVYIDNKQIHITDYVKKGFIFKKKHKLTCKYGHELIFCNGTKRQNYFRHKNSGDVGGHPMSEWHCRMQGYFPNTEVEFLKTNSKQIKNRRADVVLNDDYILEIQHSNIDETEIICRTNDYKLHNKNLIWLIDGNTKDIIIEKMKEGTPDESFLIEFTIDWKYKNFKHQYKYNLLEKDGQVYRINITEVTCNMIEVKESKSIEIVVNKLIKDPCNIYSMWNDCDTLKSTLILKPQIAGSGKTYNIIKSLVTCLKYKYNIVVTKQHTAKDNIKKELDEQIQRDEIHIKYNITEIEHEIYGKQIIITFKHLKTNKKCTTIMGSVDSFNYACAKHPGKFNKNFFNGLLKYIIENGPDINNKGSIRYGGEDIKLNRKTCIHVDEGQDLPYQYLQAFIRIMIDTGVDMVIVGDKLQALHYEDNVVKYLCDGDGYGPPKLPNINYKRPTKEDYVNVNRRIKTKGLASLINKLVDYKSIKDYPEISLEREDELQDIGDDIFKVIEMPDVRNDDPSEEALEKRDKFIDDIMDDVDYKVKKYNLKPWDFLFQFLFVSNNPIPAELETRLNAYFIKKTCENNTFKRFAFFHKSEVGQNINTSDSIEMVRIMSVDAAKGDGRWANYILDFTEEACKYRAKYNEYLFNCFWNTGLTRTAGCITMALKNNNDSIYRRVRKSTEIVGYLPDIQMSWTPEQLNRISNITGKDEILDILKNNEVVYKDTDEGNKEKLVCDWDDYCIRRCIYLNYAKAIINEEGKKNKNYKDSQIRTVEKKLTRMNIKTRTPNEFYTYLKKHSHIQELEYLPLCNLSHKTHCEWRNCNRLLERNITSLLNNIKDNYNKNILLNVDVYNSIIIEYIRDLYMNKHYCSISPTKILQLVYQFQIKKKGKEKEFIEEAKNIQKIMLKLIKKIYENNNEDNEIQWNIEHFLRYIGNSKNQKNKDELKIWKKWETIGWDNENVYHIHYVTDYSELNHYDVMTKLLFERFIIANPNTDKNIEKFKNKDIKTYLVVLKKNKYIHIDFSWEKKAKFEIKQSIKKMIKTYFYSKNKQLFNYYNFIKNEKITVNGKEIYKWREHGSYSSPLEYMVSKFEYKNKYVVDFFHNLHKRCVNEKTIVKEITNNEKLFQEEINKSIDDMCEKYFTDIGDVVVEADDDW